MTVLHVESVMSNNDLFSRNDALEEFQLIGLPDLIVTAFSRLVEQGMGRWGQDKLKCPKVHYSYGDLAVSLE